MSTSTPTPGTAQAPKDPVAEPRGAMRRSIYWFETEDVVARPPLRGQREADVCVVGGGYTGLWTSLMLKEAEPDLDVVVLERDVAGAGASGHNDGFATPTVGHGLHTLARLGTPDQVVAATAGVGRSILEIKRFCRKNGIDADFEASGVLTVAANDAQERELERDRALVAELSEGVAGMRVPDMIGGSELRDRLGASGLQAALPAGGALINPFKLARGLARVAVERGIELCEHTAVGSVRRDGDGWLVVTPSGSVRARKVLMATNAYQFQFPAFKRSVAPVWSYAMVSDPLTEAQLDRVDWASREGFVEVRNFILFMRLTVDDRILVGGGPAPYHRGRDMNDRHIDAPAIFDFLAKSLVRYYPEWRDVTYSHAYGGCVAMTRDLLPHVGRRSDGLVYAHGYCGNGIAMTHSASKAVRDLLLERDTDETRQMYVSTDERKLPPEPLLAVGAGALTRALAFSDEHPRVFRRFGGIG